MYFNPEDISFTFLGEEPEQGASVSEQSAKDALLDFFSKNRNIRFTAKELAHRIGYSDSHTRNSLSGLAVDGLISYERREGYATNYFLVLEVATTVPHSPSETSQSIASDELKTPETESIAEYSSTPPAPLQHPISTPHQHPLNLCTASNTDLGDYLSTEKSPSEEVEFEKNNKQFSCFDNQQQPEALPGNNCRGADGGADGVIVADDDRPSPPPLNITRKSLPSAKQGRDG